MLKRAQIDFVETHQDGTAKGAVQRLNFADLRRRLAIQFPRKDHQNRLLHLLRLSAAAPGHPIDLTIMSDPASTAVDGITAEFLIWSARVWFVAAADADPSRGTSAAASDVS